MRIIFTGRKKYSAELLDWLVSQGVEIVAVCTDNQFDNSPTAAKAAQLNIPVISMEEAEELLIGGEKVDLVVSYLYWRKIRKPLIELPKYGCINFHPAILPAWRGVAGYNIAIMKGLKEWGATAHYVDESIDTGRIIKVATFPFNPETSTVVSLEKQTQEVQMELFKEIILRVKNEGILPSTIQTKEQGTYISRAEMEKMKEIDLEKEDLETIKRKVRAFWFPPYDGANIEIDGHKFTLIDEEILKTLVSKDTTSVK